MKFRRYLSVPGDVFEGDALRLDRDAALALDIHRIEHLFLHLAVTEPPAVLYKAIGQRRLAVVDMGDDRKFRMCWRSLKARTHGLADSGRRRLGLRRAKSAAL
jgi:hypothetical protein